MKTYFVNIPVGDKRIKNSLITKYELIMVTEDSIKMFNHESTPEAALTIALRGIKNVREGGVAHIFIAEEERLFIPVKSIE